MLLPVRRSPDITLSARISFGTICGPCWSLFRFPILPRKVWTKSKGSLGRKSRMIEDQPGVAGLSFAAGSSVPSITGAKFCGWFRGIHR